MFFGQVVLLFEVVHSTVNDLDLSSGFGVVRVGRHIPEGLNHVVTLDYFAKNDVLLVQPTGFGQQDKKLRAIRVFAF